MQARLGESAREKEELGRQLEERAKQLESYYLGERNLKERLKQLEYENVNLRLDSERVAVRSNELKQTISKITAPQPQN
jgi:regulator of replication initiation timing